MIFAPRSCPSSPGLAITTRIFRATAASIWTVKLTVVGCSPAWPNPGSAQSGYLVEGAGRVLIDCGPGVLARLRELEPPWPSPNAIVISHFHVDHWGDLVPWVVGCAYGPGRSAEKPELWLPPGGHAELATLSGALGTEGLLDETFRIAEYADRVTLRAAGFEIVPHEVPHYDIATFGMRVSESARTLAYSADSAPSERLVELARSADLFICEATLERGDLDGPPRGHLDANEAQEHFAASGARRLLLTHRPQELPLPGTLE